MNESGQQSAVGFNKAEFFSRQNTKEGFASPKQRSSIMKLDGSGLEQVTGEHAFQRRNMRKGSTLIGFQVADWEKACKHRDQISNRYYKGSQVSLGVELDHFKVYGPGVFLFFHFLKNLTFFFLFASLIALIPIIYNYVVGSEFASYKLSSNVYIGKTTIGNFSVSSSLTDKLMNTVPDLTLSLALLGFYFYWLHKSEKLTEQVRKQVKMRSYTVIELTDFPKNATEEQVYKFMSQFGNVTELAPIRDCAETISLSKEIYEKQLQIQELKIQKNAENAQKIKEKQEQIQQFYKQLALEEDSVSKDTIKYYISYQTISEKENALRELKKYQKSRCLCCADNPPQNMLLLGQRIKAVACHTQPGEIIWQNQHITWATRWIRALMQLIFLLILIAIGFVFISFLNILSPQTSTTNSVDTSAYTSTSILSVSNSTIVQSWCISNIETVETAGSSSSVYTLCYSYITQYYLKIAITIGISIVIISMKTILKKIVISLAKFQRYNSQTEQSIDIIQNLYLTYLCTTVLITFLLQAQIFGISFKQTISLFINNSYLTSNLSNLNQYSDFVNNWYVDVGYSIFLTWVIMAIHPTITMLPIHHLMECYKNWRAKGEKIQKKMDKKIQQDQFDIEDHYANILLIISVTIVLAGGMPIIIIPCFIALGSRYLYFKYLFIRFSKIPKTLDEALDIKVTSFLPYILLVHFKLSIWMFGVTSIFAAESSSIGTYLSNLNSTFLQKIGFLILKLQATWYYSMVYLAVIAIIVLKQIIYNLIAKSFIARTKEQKLPTVMTANYKNDMLQITDNLPVIQSDRGICSSYKIENNPDYFEILAIMNKKKKYIVRVKQ